MCANLIIPHETLSFIFFDSSVQYVLYSYTLEKAVEEEVEMAQENSFSINNSSVTIENTERYHVIKLSEKVDPEIFISELTAKMENNVEYIQPDYTISLASDDEAIVLETEYIEPDEEQSDAENIIDNENNDFQESIQEETTIVEQEEQSPSEEIIAETDTFITNENPIENLAEIKIGLIDTGVDVTHPELSDYICTQNGETVARNIIDNNDIVFDVNNSNDSMHGTHIAGIIAGKSSLSYQNVSNIQIIPVKAFSNGSAQTSDIINAIQFAIDNGAKIINCSWGSTEENPALKEIIEDNEDVLFICASGNGRKDIGETKYYPASFDLPNIISVASINNDNGFSYFSNYSADIVDIAKISNSFARIHIRRHIIFSKLP